MLFLQFKNGDDRYLLEARDIIEIVPFASLKLIPKAPPYVVGLLNYRGNTIPVIDICYIMSEKACEMKLSSRIALINYKLSNDESRPIGLLIEHMTKTVRREEGDFSESGVNLKDSPYLGKVLIDDIGILQRVNISELIPGEANDILFESRD